LKATVQSRFLFALAGLACVLVIYLFVKEISNWKSGLIASTLFSFNGFFVAFSRIVQYQSFVILFTLLAAYFLIKLNKTSQIKYLYFSSISAALGLLSHYDIAFAGLYFIYLLVVFLISAFKNKQLPIKHVIFSGIVFISLVSTFYVPFLMHQASQNTASYLFMRINGSDGGNKTTDTFITYLIYNPLTSFYIYFVGVLLSCVVLFRKNWLIFVFWFLPPFVIMNFFASIPGTHIYTYVIPAIILFSLLLGFLYEKITNSVLKYLSTTLFVFFSSFFTIIFVFIIYPSAEFD
jgi:4-amino-4-deoxy-L-arabinose transferase-like glycosyltransferase